MKYKVGDEVLVKAKIIEVSSTGIFRVDSNGARYYLQENDIVAEMTAEEAWELARRIVLNEDEGGIKSSDLLNAFGTNYWHEIMKNNNSPQEVKARIEAWEAKKEIKVGDEVALKSAPYNDNYKFFVTCIDKKDGEISGWSGFGGGVFYGRDIKQYQKTGRHIDIEGLLKQIGGTDA